jgi:hypothetical protein
MLRKVEGREYLAYTEELEGVQFLRIGVQTRDKGCNFGVVGVQRVARLTYKSKRRRTNKSYGREEGESVSVSGI